MVTSFPFSIVDDPMYFGSFLNFLGVAMVKSSPAGILLAFLAGAVYKVALHFETPFVKAVYEAKAKSDKKMAFYDDGDEGEDDDEEEEDVDVRQRPQKVRKKEE